MKEKIIVSSCLLGYNTKYNGKNNYQEKIELIKEKYAIYPVCPEVLGGLSTPRDPSEIKDGRVLSSKGLDVTANFNKGANFVLELVKKEKIKKAILKESSPSCGKNHIYDGSFSKKLISGQGVTASLLNQLDIEIYNEDELDLLLAN